MLGGGVLCRASRRISYCNARSTCIRLYLVPRRGASSAAAASSLAFHAEDERRQLGHLYAVTNGHVLQSGATVIRLNKVGGGADYIETNASLWTYSEVTDLAVFPLSLSGKTHQHLAISIDLFLDKNRLVGKAVGPGDETFVVGRFINHEGLQQNRPSVRFGTISVMPYEKDGIFNNYLGKKLEAYLVETHTISGYSGSPVFFYIPPLSKRPETRPASIQQRGPWLLGIDWGHIPIYEAVYKKPDLNNKTDYVCESTTGMMCVIPAWHLRDLLNDPALEEERRSIDEATMQPTDKSAAAVLDGPEWTRDEILRAALNAPHKPPLKPKAKAAKRARGRVNSK